MGEFGHIKDKYMDWLYASIVVDHFRKIYPSAQVFEEMLDSGSMYHKAFSPFTKRFSKEPQMYMREAYFFDFETGYRGNAKDLILHDHSPLTRTQKIRYLSDATGIDLIEVLRKYPDEWDLLMGKTNDINTGPDTELGKFSKLGVNSSPLNDGSWVNRYTDKTENPLEYYLRGFDDFYPETQREILIFMPSVKKAIEARPK